MNETALLKYNLLKNKPCILEWWLRSNMFLDWIYPPKCIACNGIFVPVHNRERTWLCDNCQPLLEIVPDPICPICGYPIKNGLTCPSCYNRKFYFSNHRAVFLYDDVVRDLLIEVKFRSRRRSIQGLGYIFAETAKNWDINGDYILPVPLHPSKKRSRGFNQAAYLAYPLSKAVNIPLAEDLLKRAKKTTPQSGLTAAAREQNLTDAFTIGKKYKLSGKRVIIIDDIYTSGATMNACAKILMENGASEVTCASLSIALLPQKQKT